MTRRADLLVRATRWITPAALHHGDALLPHVMERAGLSRRQAGELLAALVETNWLERAGSPRNAIYYPGALRQVVKRYPIFGLQEDLPWGHDVAPCLDLAPELARLAQHAFTELVNNAIEHSAGQFVTVSVRQTASHLQMLVSDDGCGLFERVCKAFRIADASLAMLELSKGKLTSQPERHLGQGLFFVARVADIFELHANQRSFRHFERPGAVWERRAPMPHSGTSAYLAIALDTERTLDRVLQSHSADGESFSFDATHVPVHLLTGPQVGLESRAQARRVAHRLAAFQRAEIDFSGVGQVGPAFADELFRVFARAHPQVSLQPTGCSPGVNAMLWTLT